MRSASGPVATTSEIAAALGTTASPEDAQFEHAPPIAALRKLGLAKVDNDNINRRALLIALIAWLPLVLLTIAQTAWSDTNTLVSLFWEVGLHARYLIAVPLLVLAEAFCAPQLNAIVRHFLTSGVVAGSDRLKLTDAVTSTRRSLNSPVAEIIVVALAYLVAGSAAVSYTVDQLPMWATSHGLTPYFSPAGWWHMLVSLPLLLVLIFGWMWRLIVWTRLLSRLSRLELKLVASHPDRCAGLSFLGHSLRAFAIVAMSLAVIVAGRSAHMVLAGSPLPSTHFYFNAGLLIAILVLFMLPLLVFIGPILHEWQRSTLEYGTLANQIGHTFEHKWLRSERVDDDTLEKPDFSATADYYAIVENVHSMRFAPIDIKDLIAITAALLLPFVPVILLAIPTDTILASLKKLLL